MDTSSELSQQKSGYGLKEYRGVMTNTRGIRTTISKDGQINPGVYDSLVLPINELIGKKILDVGVGGGKSLEESRRSGLDVIGVEIAPTISVENDEDVDPIHKVDIKNVVLNTQNDLANIAEKYPGSIIGADATVALPFSDDSFDIVLSNLALPGYARNPKEVATSLLEMIRIAKERVVITGTDFKEEDKEGIASFGSRPSFQMAYKEFLNYLTEKLGITYKVIPPTPDRANPAFHFDLTSKKSDIILKERSNIIEMAEKLRR